MTSCLSSTWSLLHFKMFAHSVDVFFIHKFHCVFLIPDEVKHISVFCALCFLLSCTHFSIGLFFLLIYKSSLHTQDMNSLLVIYAPQISEFEFLKNFHVISLTTRNLNVLECIRLLF